MVVAFFLVVYFFFFKQKTAYEMRISDWSSDVCSSDLRSIGHFNSPRRRRHAWTRSLLDFNTAQHSAVRSPRPIADRKNCSDCISGSHVVTRRSEEHTSELQSLMRISYAVFCLKKKKNNTYMEKISHKTNKLSITVSINTVCNN